MGLGFLPPQPGWAIKYDRVSPLIDRPTWGTLGRRAGARSGFQTSVLIFYPGPSGTLYGPILPQTLEEAGRWGGREVGPQHRLRVSSSLPDLRDPKSSSELSGDRLGGL